MKQKHSDHDRKEKAAKVSTDRHLKPLKILTVPAAGCQSILSSTRHDHRRSHYYSPDDGDPLGRHPGHSCQDLGPDSAHDLALALAPRDYGSSATTDPGLWFGRSWIVSPQSSCGSAPLARCGKSCTKCPPSFSQRPVPQSCWNRNDTGNNRRGRIHRLGPQNHSKVVKVSNGAARTIRHSNAYR